MDTKKEKLVFVAILRVQGLMGGDRVFVSTTLRGVCRGAGLTYSLVAKRWSRRDKEGDRISSENGGKPWSVILCELDRVRGRGGVKNFIKNLGVGMRGYKHADGKLHAAPERKRTLADDIILPQRGSIEGVDIDYEP